MDIFQQVFGLSMVSNGASESISLAALHEEQIRAKLLGAKAANPGLDPWEITWGPVVYQRDLLGQAVNAMVVFSNPLTGHVVVAVAATNGFSIFDWMTEDADVAPADMVAFPAGGNISAGTHIGVTNLTNMVDPISKKSLADYLSGVVESASKTLIFTGHSLGGALSPTLAMTLYPKGADGAWKAIHVYPTAGATPGDNDFVTAFRNAYPQTVVDASTPYAVWNTDFWNSLDVVPHAWAPATLAEIPTLYVMSSGVGSWLTTLIQTKIEPRAEDASGNNPYVQLPNTPWTGSTQQTSPLNSIPALLKEILYQHIEAYIKLFGLNRADPTPMFSVGEASAESLTSA